MTVRVSFFEKLCSTPQKLAVRWRQRGMGDAYGRAWVQCQWRFREWRLGANTPEFAHGIIVETEGEQHGYEPIDHRCFDLQQPLNQMKRSPEKYPRTLRLVYLQPLDDENPMAQVSWLLHEADLPTGYRAHIRSLVYEAKVPGLRSTKLESEQ